MAITVNLGRYELWVREQPDLALEYFLRACQAASSFVDARVPISFYLAKKTPLLGSLRDLPRFAKSQEKRAIAARS